MIIFQRYVIRELIAPILLSILFFTFVMILRQLFTMAEMLLEANIGWQLFLELLGVMTLSLIVLTVPMAALLGVLVGIGRLTSENEILAVRVSGTSLFRIFYPIIIIGFVGAGILMYCGFYFVPWTAKNFMDKRTQIEFELLTNLQPGRNYDQFSPAGSDLYLYFNEHAEPRAGDSPYTLRMKHVAMRIIGESEDMAGGHMRAGYIGEVEEGWDPEESEWAPKYLLRGDQETLFFANEGMIEGNIEDFSVTLHLETGTIIPLNRVVYEVTRADGSRNPLGRDGLERNISVGFETLEKTIRPRRAGDRRGRIEPGLFTIGELYEFVQKEPTGPMFQQDRPGRLTTSWREYLSARNEIFQRYSLPFALPAFILIAIPLALELRPRAKSVSFLIALLLILVYYVMITWASAVGMKNSPFTFLAFMSPNLVIGGIGLALLWRVERQ